MPVFVQKSFLFLFTFLVLVVGVSNKSFSQAAASWNYTNQTGNIGTTYSWIDCSAGTTIVNGDDAVINISWPFDFDFYGNSYTTANQLSVSSNGFIRLDGTASANYTIARNYDLTSTATELGQIVGPAIYDGNVNTSFGSWCRYLVTGSAPNRILTIEYNHYEIDWQDLLYTDVQVSFYENSNKIVLKLGFDNIFRDGVDMGIHSGINGYFNKWGEVKTLANNTWIEYTPVPLLTVTPTNLDFGYVALNSTSSNLSYTLTGTNLTGNVVITPPSGFKISTTPSGYSASAMTLTPTLGKINQTIYIVFNPTSSQDYTGNITHTTAGATQKNVALTGTSLAPSGACGFNNNSSSGITHTPCVDLPTNQQTAGSVTFGQYFLMNVIKGLTYTIKTCSTPNNNNNSIQLSVYDENTGNFVSFSDVNTGNSCGNARDAYLTFTSQFSGKVRVLVNRRGDCTITSNNNIPILTDVSGGSNTQDNELNNGTNTWVGHIYDGTAFNNYLGYYTQTETFQESFDTGGTWPSNTNDDNTCFDLFSNGTIRASVKDVTFSVRYRMNSTKIGLYVANITNDDGNRLFVDGSSVYSNWTDHAPQTNSNVLFSLTGSSSLILEYYENGGQNVTGFTNLTQVLANMLSNNINQSICMGNTGLAIGGDVFGTLPTGISKSGTTGYQWTYSTTPTGIRTSISGETGATYSPNSSTAPFNVAGTYYIYRNAVLSSTNNIAPNPYVVTNESNVATIIVNTPSTAPTSITGTTTTCSGGTTTLTANGGTSGTGSTYQWGTGTVGSNIISGATNASYTTVSLTSNTTFWVRRIDPAPCSTITGGVSQLVTVTTPSTAPTSMTGTTTICSGGTTTLTVSGGTSGTGSTYQWGTGTVGSNIISGVTNASYTTESLTSNTTYWVRRIDPAPCSTTTGGVTQIVSVNPLPTATISSTNDPICEQDNAEFTITGTPNAQVTYNINGNPNLTATLSTGGTAVISYIVGIGDGDQTITLKSVTNGTCTQSLNISETITVNPRPIIGGFN